MRNGYWVACGFAAGWAGAGLYASGFPPAICLLPVAVSAALLAWAYRIPATARDPGPQTRKPIGRWSLIEGIAIVISINLLHRLHHPEAIFPAVAIIVGLHFIPLARALLLPAYHATAAGLVLLGLLGLAMPATERPLTVGLGAAIVLWATALHRLLRARKASALVPA